MGGRGVWEHLVDIVTDLSLHIGSFGLSYRDDTIFANRSNTHLVGVGRGLRCGKLGRRSNAGKQELNLVIKTK